MVIVNLDLLGASCPTCIPVVVLKNCGPELSYILVELFNKCLKESCFPDCWKVSSVASVFKNVGKRSTAKNYHPVSLLSMVSKVLEKLVSNRILDQLQSFSQWYLIDLLELLTGLGILELWHLIYPRSLTRFGMLVYFANLSLMEFQVRYLALFLLFSAIDGFKWF